MYFDSLAIQLLCAGLGLIKTIAENFQVIAHGYFDCAMNRKIIVEQALNSQDCAAPLNFRDVKAPVILNLQGRKIQR